MASPVVTVLCTLTNHTADVANYVKSRDSHGQVGNKAYPQVIPSGSSGTFSHVGSTPVCNVPVISEAAVVCTDGKCDWMVCWYCPAGGENKVYTEIQAADYFTNLPEPGWESIRTSVESGSSTSEWNFNGYKASVKITPSGNSPALNASISYA